MLCTVAVHIWQQWASKGYIQPNCRHSSTAVKRLKVAQLAQCRWSREPCYTMRRSRRRVTVDRRLARRMAEAALVEHGRGDIASRRQLQPPRDLVDVAGDWADSRTSKAAGQAAAVERAASSPAADRTKRRHRRGRPAARTDFRRRPDVDREPRESGRRPWHSGCTDAASARRRWKTGGRSRHLPGEASCTCGLSASKHQGRPTTRCLAAADGRVPTGRRRTRRDQPVMSTLRWTVEDDSQHSASTRQRRRSAGGTSSSTDRCTSRALAVPTRGTVTHRCRRRSGTAGQADQWTADEQAQAGAEQRQGREATRHRRLLTDAEVPPLRPGTAWHRVRLGRGVST